MFFFHNEYVYYNFRPQIRYSDQYISSPFHRADRAGCNHWGGWGRRHALPVRNFIRLDICRKTWISPLPCHSQLVATAVAPGKLQIIRFLLSKPGDWQIFMRCKIVCIFTSKLALSQFSACQWFRIMVFVWTVDCSWGHGSWPSDGEWHICQYGHKDGQSKWPLLFCFDNVRIIMRSHLVLNMPMAVICADIHNIICIHLKI